MRTIKSLLTLFTASLIVISCNNNRTDNTANEDNKKAAEERNDAKFAKQGERDAEFVTDVQDINLAETNLGQLAESRATSKDVKELGRMMQAAHKKAYDELASLAAKKNISVPSAMSETAKKDYDNLNDKAGKDFDKEYCDMMVKGHKDAIDKFEKATKDAADPDIQAWAANTLPELRKHLDHAMNVQDALENNKRVTETTDRDRDRDGDGKVDVDVDVKK
jgi:putative membrane protein